MPPRLTAASSFAFAIASVSLYVFIFFESRLYAESGLQIFFILANIWGWVLWYRAAQDGIDDARVPVRWLDWQSRAVWLTVTAAISLNLGWLMHRYTNAAMPFADSAIAGASVAAQILLEAGIIKALPDMTKLADTRFLK